jgi:HEPN domain-containing protein
MEHEIAAEWFRFADMDLETAEYIQGKRPQPHEIICYLCQQSAEKNLKGYLIYKGVAEPPRIHKLDILCELCSEQDEGFAEIKRACGALNRYGIQPRYPNELGITENDTRKALEYARQIRDFQQLAEARSIRQQH